MPRHPDPDLEERVLRAADGLWKRGGEHALTMRAVARAAGTNTPAVYRRFKNREDLIRGLLLRIAGRIRQQFEEGETIEQMADRSRGLFEHGGRSSLGRASRPCGV